MEEGTQCFYLTCWLQTRPRSIRQPPRCRSSPSCTQTRPWHRPPAGQGPFQRRSKLVPQHPGEEMKHQGLRESLNKGDFGGGTMDKSLQADTLAGQKCTKLLFKRLIRHQWKSHLTVSDSVDETCDELWIQRQALHHVDGLTWNCLVIKYQLQKTWKSNITEKQSWLTV